jgi:hypothetical protein
MLDIRQENIPACLTHRIPARHIGSVGQITRLKLNCAAHVDKANRQISTPEQSKQTGKMKIFRFLKKSPQ